MEEVIPRSSLPSITPPSAACTLHCNPSRVARPGWQMGIGAGSAHLSRRYRKRHIFLVRQETAPPPTTTTLLLHFLELFHIPVVLCGCHRIDALRPDVDVSRDRGLQPSGMEAKNSLLCF